jgi:hypothetical protein
VEVVGSAAVTRGPVESVTDSDPLVHGEHSDCLPLEGLENSKDCLKSRSASFLLDGEVISLIGRGRWDVVIGLRSWLGLVWLQLLELLLAEPSVRLLELLWLRSIEHCSDIGLLWGAEKEKSLVVGGRSFSLV